MALQKITPAERLYWELKDIRKRIDNALREFASAGYDDEVQPVDFDPRCLDPQTGKRFQTKTEIHLEKKNGLPGSE